MLADVILLLRVEYEFPFYRFNDFIMRMNGSSLCVPRLCCVVHNVCVSLWYVFRDIYTFWCRLLVLTLTICRAEAMCGVCVCFAVRIVSARNVYFVFYVERDHWVRGDARWHSSEKGLREANTCGWFSFICCIVYIYSSRMHDGVNIYVTKTSFTAIDFYLLNALKETTLTSLMGMRCGTGGVRGH